MHIFRARPFAGLGTSLWLGALGAVACGGLTRVGEDQAASSKEHDGGAGGAASAEPDASDNSGGYFSTGGYSSSGGAAPGGGGSPGNAGTGGTGGDGCIPAGPADCARYGTGGECLADLRASASSLPACHDPYEMGEYLMHCGEYDAIAFHGLDSGTTTFFDPKTGRPVARTDYGLTTNPQCVTWLPSFEIPDCVEPAPCAVEDAGSSTCAPPVPSQLTYSCDPLPPGEPGGCGPSLSFPGSPAPPPVDPDVRYPVGCTVTYPFAHPWYPCSPAACTCEDSWTAGGAPEWLCPL